MTRIWIQLVGSKRYEVEITAQTTIEELTAKAASLFDLSCQQLTLVHGGKAMHNSCGPINFKEGEVILAMPRRKIPAAHIVSAALDMQLGGRSRGENDPEDDEDLPSQLPPNAQNWEKFLVAWLKSRGYHPLVTEWVVLLRPVRAVAVLIFIIGCLVSSRLGLGPVFVLVSIVYIIFSNLGRRGANEFSAYSIFNAGIQRLPGQLDADQIDQQVRRGQLG
ncbi:hypothetical protein CEUSTIGMA_g90.t1 [Chlamydomonas eustigma]|uniref:SAYSvFN domain-containing protein n=1 Tax=Chlamydomonas eustigma TaxID=1157962 RepID=A0A250WP66_9CHLO|nr:hypothetical protein CEUSTIGMA_g90.t1 [Chlamydomonas eustigma]|eukprot:GAX72634.1 hypothetical protein CEUSTIGMA_g90.t1 [Chlamydomonas eustigma]